MRSTTDGGGLMPFYRNIAGNNLEAGERADRKAGVKGAGAGDFEMSVLTRNNVRVGGQADGQTIMFAHGFGCDQTMWRFVVPAFEDEYRIILFDHVGAGRSDLSAYDAEKYSSLDGYAKDAVEICHELDLHDVIFVGHSVSSIIGVLASIREPERFQKLVLVGPSPAYINDGDYVGGFTREDIDELLESLDSNYLGWSSAMAPLIMGNPDRPELGEELTNSFCRTDPAIARHFAHVTFTSDNRADLADVKIPVLVLQCSEDAIAPRGVGEFVHRAIPSSEFVLMKATGHCPNLSAPAETIAAIKAFL
jgi:sigma-B regulation protein RsbQ